ncbi:hypothetical protein M3P05_05495 [Sansalvadorimonas sp. 2012CJ34-2]|uniref:Uncharacterized protein n=1 Tax=Parendozoicomonas callyspongiae TaxID=2942213 RepID=A0ABT0PDG5_9GAMM|nr:hypothetical protein [Sansalvadorimonas sp. 2012CJ34-2]MCL6269400.1 hypothetical protein [Sansalvadorimonas sp. 2012CJ34-2]
MAQNNEFNIGHLMTFIALIGSVVLWGFEIERRITKNGNQIESLKDIINLEREEYHRIMFDIRQDLEQIEDRILINIPQKK